MCDTFINIRMPIVRTTFHSENRFDYFHASQMKKMTKKSIRFENEIEVMFCRRFLSSKILFCLPCENRIQKYTHLK